MRSAGLPTRGLGQLAATVTTARIRPRSSAADAAERAGRLDAAVRLRFRAGLLRLGDRGAIRYRPSVTTNEVRRVLGSETFDELARTFDAIAYGGRDAEPPDVDAARREWPRVVAGAAKRSGIPLTDVTESKSGRRFAIAAVVIVGAIIALNVLAQGLDRAVGGNEPSGVAGSSYGTQGTGLAAAASLFTHYGHPVSRQRGSLATTALDPAATVFVIEPQSLTDADDAALLAFVSGGGRLVIGGSDPFYLRRLRDRPPEWSAGGAASYVEIDPSLGARRVEAAGRGSWKRPGSGTVLAHSGDTALLTAEHVGRGEILFLADASPIENAYLAHADDAAFALGLAGDPTAPVVFDEGTHGYGAARGLERDPDRVEGLTADPRGRRGRARVVAEPPARSTGSSIPGAAPGAPSTCAPSPSRSSELAIRAPRSHRCNNGHDRTSRGAHTSRSDASLEEIDRAAITLGCSESERAAMWYPPTDDNTALALGQLVSRLSQDERSHA